MLFRSDYSSLLLKLAAQENFPAGIPLSFCRGGSKTRIKNVVRYRPQKAFSAALTVLLIAVTLYGCMGNPKENLSAPDAKALQTEADFNETQTKASSAAESEELAFAKKFVSAIVEASTNIIADDIYEMLSSELKAEANSLTCSLDIRRLDTGHYMTSYGPFIPGEPVITEESAQKNYFITSFDNYSLKKGLEILSGVQEVTSLTKVLFSKDMIKEEDDYLNFLSLGHKIVWNEYRIYFPIENGDLNVIYENQRLSKIKFRKLSVQYKDGLAYLAQEILGDISESNIRKAIKAVEKGG